MPFVAAEEDSGPLVKALVQESAGKNLIGYREWLTMEEFTEAFTRASGIKSELVTVSLEQFAAALPEDLKVEMADNIAYFNDFGYEGRDDPTVIHPKAVSISQAFQHRSKCCPANIAPQLSSPPKLASVVDYMGKQDWSKILGA